MKVLGNNSLSSKVLIGLKFVIIVTVIAMIFITSILIKDVRDMALYGNQKLEETIIISGFLCSHILCHNITISTFSYMHPHITSFLCIKTILTAIVIAAINIDIKTMIQSFAGYPVCTHLVK